jgi:Cof subfamily protein (haloacid dehalogenase superfamily)
VNASVRLVATDLDGTLVHSDGSVTPRTRAALVAAEEAGVQVVFVTGRPLRWAEEVFEHVGGHGQAIISNGGLVWDVARARVHLMRAIEPTTGLEVARRLRDAVPDTHFAIEMVLDGPAPARDAIALEPGFMERYGVPEGSARGPIEQIFATPAVKLLARHETLEPLEFWARAEEAAGDLVEITWSSTTSLLEISAGGVTKASTLALLCAEHGVAAEEVLAIGDMPNDLPMLSWAGTSYAMANAHPTVREAADHVAPANDDDGVARVIEALLDSRVTPRQD